MFKTLVISAVLSIMLVACQACVSNISHVRESMELDEIETLVESTVKVELDFTSTKKVNDGILVYEGSRQGTGVVLGHSGTSTLVLTVSHICEVPAVVKKGNAVFTTVSSSFRVMNYSGNVLFTARPIRQDMTNDLCVMTVEGKIGRPVSFAGIPRRLSRVVVVGGPIGLFGDGVSYVGEGRLVGLQSMRGLELGVVSVAMSNGGSGSGVFHRGKLIGIITAVSTKFNHGTVFVPIGTVKKFLESR
jgi:hypothetical protein